MIFVMKIVLGYGVQKCALRSHKNLTPKTAKIRGGAGTGRQALKL